MPEISMSGIPPALREEFTAWTDEATFVRRLGIEFDELSPRRVRAHLDADGRHHQPLGLVHGGVYSSVIETLASLGGAANAYADGQVVVGVNNSTDFLRPHRTGRLDAVGRPLHVGRTQQLWEVVISRASDGKDVARGTVRLHNVSAEDFGPG